MMEFFPNIEYPTLNQNFGTIALVQTSRNSNGGFNTPRFFRDKYQFFSEATSFVVPVEFNK